MRMKSPGLCLEQSRKLVTFSLLPFFLLYLHFICLSAACPSSVVLWGAGRIFSSLTNVVQIACRMTMGEHLDLGHSLFVVAALFEPILLSFFHSSPLLCFSDSVKWKNSCLTCFQPCRCGLDPQDRVSCRGHLQQDVGFIITAVNNACLISRTLAAVKPFSYLKEVFLQEIFFCLFVVFKHIHFLRAKQYNNVLGWGGECQGRVQLEVTQHAVVQ